MSSGKENFFWKLHERQLQTTGFFSAEFKDLFERMMRYEPSERLPISEIIKHPWFNGEVDHNDEKGQTGGNMTAEEVFNELDSRR